jgi:hypothetical protein
MKAVIFNHFHNSVADYDKRRATDQVQQLGAEEENRITESVLPYYKAYLKCPNIGLVYVYVDTGIKQILDNGFETDEAGKIKIDINELAFEHTVRNILKLAVDQALRELSKDEGFDPSGAPKFQFIGLPHLSALIASLYRMDKALVRDLAGRGQFTYDAPKFVEAVIRLARGKDSLLSGDPVLRFDQDVEVNPAAIDALLNKVQNSIIRRYGYSFFSGGYGTLNGVYDPVNDHAVRCHWLADLKDNNQPPFHLVPNGAHFLRDIGEFGATSIPNSRNVPLSTAMNDYVVRQGGDSTNRDSEQVISGAGLYMSLSAILRLPPFMNFENNIIWVDDHLKRRLHEVLGDLATTDLEHVDASLFHQDRYPKPKGIQQADINWAEKNYFYRLVSGCILHALIVTRKGERGHLAKFVAKFLLNRRPAKEDELKKLSAFFMATAKKTVQDLLEIWATAEYGNDTLKKWAEKNQKELDQGTGELVKSISSTVDDAIHYCKLVQNWNAYVVAIQDLVPHDAYWLFRSAS